MSEVQTTAVEVVKLTAEQKLQAKAKTLFDRITADTAEYHRVVDALQALQAVANVAAGDNLLIKQGKGETATEVAAVVLGVSEVEGAKKIKVQIGEGFDTQVVIVSPAQVVSVVYPEAEATVAEEAAE